MATWREARRNIEGLTERQVQEHLHNFVHLWAELFPAEQARILHLLVARIEVSSRGADITLRTDGLGLLMQDLGSPSETQEQAA